jgi:hypothetical protein
MHRLSTILLALVLTLFTGRAGATPSVQTNTAPGEIIIALHPGYRFDAQGHLYGGHASFAINALATRIDSYAATPIVNNSFLLRYRDSSDPSVLAARFVALEGVRYAEPNYQRTLLRTPNDTIIGQQWALERIEAFAAWDITTGGEIVIAVLDTGVDGGHSDLNGKVLPGFNALSGSSDAGDDNGHGTAVSGLIAANTDNGVGIAGACWGCKILPVKVLNANGGGNDAGVATGMRWAIDNGARVLNLSLGGPDESQTLREAVDYAEARGVLVIASSGNEQREGNLPNYPAAYDSVLAVGATGNSDVITGFSNTGDYVDIAAPGVGLWTTILGNTYGTPNGTSFSSPYVAGVAGLAYTLRGDLGAADMRCLLTASADDKGAPGKDPEYGWGRVNARRAVELAQAWTGCPQTAPQPEPAPQPAPQPDPAPQPPSSGSAPPAFTPIPPFESNDERSYFPETGHSLGGEFKRYWERNGGLSVFGYPLSEEYTELGSDGRSYTVQYFQRNIFEYHPENQPPYNVLIRRIGDEVLRAQGRDWFIFPKTGQQPGCLYFEQTGNALCEPFLSAWRSQGLEFDGRGDKSFEESLALFGQPISPPQIEEIAPGVVLTVQWFERGRFEDHGSSGVLLGLLGDEITRLRGWRS